MKMYQPIVVVDQRIAADRPMPTHDPAAFVFICLLPALRRLAQRNALTILYAENVV